MLRVAVTGPDRDVVAAVATAWSRADEHRVDVEAVPWPAGLDVAAGHHLVVGVTPGDAPVGDAVDVWIAPDEASALWAGRVVPFAANLAAGRRAPRARVARLVGPDSRWPAQAQRVIARIRATGGGHVLRADHIGSTSVLGLPAKDLVDVQVVVRDLETADGFAEQAGAFGLVDAGEWDLPDRAGRRFPERVLVDADPGRPTNVNLRPVDHPVWRETLLFRDWLRADSANRDAYLAEKRRLAQETDHVDAYGDGKLGWISAALARAEAWAAATGWTP